MLITTTSEYAFQFMILFLVFFVVMFSTIYLLKKLL